MKKRILAITIFTITLCTVSVHAQQPEGIDGGLPTADARGEAAGGGFLQVFNARVGGYIPLVLPMGEVGSVLGMGFGINAFFDVSLDHLPFMAFTKTLGLPGFYTRTGLLAGFHALSGTTAANASASLIPFTVYAQAGWEVAPKIKPFLSLGSGMGLVSVSRDQVGNSPGGSVSSVDALLHIGLGASYEINPQIEALFMTSYNMYFEEVTGSFLIIHLGAGYRF